MTGVNNNKITMTRGDTFVSTVSISDNGTPWTPEQGDVIHFAMKHQTMILGGKKYNDVEPIIVKTIPTDTMTLRIDPADTKSLDFGEYVYDIEVTFSDGNVDTVINNAPLTLLPEVY